MRPALDFFGTVNATYGARNDPGYFANVLAQCAEVVRGSDVTFVLGNSKCVGAVNHDALAVCLAQDTQSGSKCAVWLQIRMERLEVKGELSMGSTERNGKIFHFTIGCREESHRDELTMGTMVRDRFRRDVFGTNSQSNAMVAPSDVVRWPAHIVMPKDVAPGKYNLMAALHTEDKHVGQCYQWTDSARFFESTEVLGPQFAGLCRLRVQFEMGPAPDRRPH